MSTLILSTLGFSNHPSDFLHLIFKTFPIVPNDPFAKICINILPVKIGIVASFIPPRPSINKSTVTRPIIVVIVVRTEEHSVMVQHTVSWKQDNDEQRQKVLRKILFFIQDCFLTTIKI